jgi:hypothetical protein
MNPLIEMVTRQLSGAALGQLSQQIGANPSQTQSALTAALPLLLSALSRNASSAQGAAALHTAVTNDHDGSILDNVMGFLGNSQAGPGAAILQHVLGGQQQTVTSGLAQSTGMNPSAIGQLLQTVAPLVLGAVGRTTQQQGLNPAQLAQMLGSQNQVAQTAAPGLLGSLNKLLDSDGDGSALNDVAGMLGKFLGSR